MHGFQEAVVAGVLLSASAVVFAQAGGGAAAQKCSATQLQQLGAQLGVARFTQTEKGVVVSAACKVWPKDASKTLIAVAYATKVAEEKGFVVAITETATGKLQSLYRNAIEEDAAMELREGNLSIDTARYDLSKNVRAFAVDVTSSARGASCPDGGVGPERSLFVQDGAAVKRVVESLYLTSWQYHSGSSCAQPDQPEPVVEEFATSIDIAKTATNGFADLLISMTSKLDNGAKSIRQPFRYTLKYDGKQYPTEAMGDAYWKWSQ